MAYQWYALHVKPHKEQSVDNLLRSRDMEVFYPSLKVKPVNPRARKIRPFFPGYLFVYLDLEEAGKNVLSWTEGVYGLVQFGGEPTSVPDVLIEELRMRLEKIQADGGLVREEFEPGDRVQIVEGPFEGYEAIFDTRLSGNDRVQVLLTFLNQQPKRLHIDSSEIRKVKNSSTK